jgi:hypothetical protein
MARQNSNLRAANEPHPPLIAGTPVIWRSTMSSF